MALYNNPYQYSFGVPGQMNQFQQQPVQIPAQPVQQPQQNNSGILWVSGEVGAKSYLVAPGTSVLLMDSESEKFFIKSTDVSGMPQPLRTFEYHEVGSQMPPKQPVQNMDSKDAQESRGLGDVYKRQICHQAGIRRFKSQIRRYSKSIKFIF